LDNQTFVEITRGDFSCTEKIGDVWTAEELMRGDFRDGDKILIDPEDREHTQGLSDIGFEFSGQTRDFDGMQIWY
jgi:hypothetical protein